MAAVEITRRDMSSSELRSAAGKTASAKQARRILAIAMVLDGHDRTLAAQAGGMECPIEVWYQDEARVGQHGTLTRLWAKRGSWPRIKRDRRFIWAYLFGPYVRRAEPAPPW